MHLNLIVAAFFVGNLSRPKSTVTYRPRGLAWSAKKGYAKAIADVSECPRLNSNHAPAFYDRGNLWSLTWNNYDKAIADYDESIRLDPNSVPAFTTAATCG